MLKNRVCVYYDSSSYSGANSRNSTSNPQTPNDGFDQAILRNPRVQGSQPNTTPQPDKQKITPNTQTLSNEANPSNAQVQSLHTNPQAGEQLTTNQMHINLESYSQRLRLGVMKTYLEQVESRDKICRAIQYGSKFISGGEAGVAHEIDVSTGLARKVFRLLKVGGVFMNSF